MMRSVLPLNYKRGPDDRPTDADRWQQLEHRAAAICFVPALTLTLIAGILVMGSLLGRGAVDRAAFGVGFLFLLPAAFASCLTALFAWSANRYSCGLLGGPTLRTGVVLVLVNAVLIGFACAFARL